MVDANAPMFPYVCLPVVCMYRPVSAGMLKQGDQRILCDQPPVEPHGADYTLPWIWNRVAHQCLHCPPTTPAQHN